MRRLQITLLLLIVCSCTVSLGFGSMPCKEAERAALLNFKHSFNIDTCNSTLSSWVGQDCCSWEGVGCDNVTGNVIKLDHIESGLCLKAKEVNPSLLELKFLRYLDLGDLDFNGSRIPEFFGSMSELQYLDLSLASFGGKAIPRHLGNLTKLIYLDLSFACDSCEMNSFEWAFMLENLKYLDLSGIDLSRALDTLDVLHKLPSLPKLILSYCQLGNSHLAIRNSNVSYSIIEYLDLRANHFSGPFPPFIQNLTSIKSLDLSLNRLTSSIPSWLGHNRYLEQLNLDGNSFNGLFPQFTQNLSFLTGLGLSANQLSSSIPSWLASKRYLKYLDLSSNHFHSVEGGIMNIISRLCSLIFLDLSNNQLVEELSESYSNFSECSRYDLELPTTGSLESFQDMITYNSGNAMPSLQSLSLANNEINGSIPRSLCHLSSLEVLDLQKNRLSGVIPDCWVNSRIVSLELSSNALSGPIPTSLTNFGNLQLLSLNNNSLEGKLPYSSLMYSPLMVLDVGKNNLDGEIPLWINGSYVRSLQILVLRENRFKGIIPPQLCSFDALQVIDLASNNLTGTIPLCFGNFKGMIDSIQTPLVNDLQLFDDDTYANRISVVEDIKGQEREYTTTILELLVNMDLSCNNLAGVIPANISSLTRLLGLNLSHNHLNGTIPKEMGKMASLESLDLSSNNLSGPIPESISSLDSLSKLNLSFNNLQGKIPTGRHFQTLDDPSIYAGNPGLYGDPLPKRCFGDDTAQCAHILTSMVHEDEGDSKHEKMWFYMVIMLGFATGFWGVIGVLVFQRKWRHAYFRLAEEIVDWIYVRVAVRIAQANRGR